MKVEQIYTIINAVTEEVLGQEVIVAEDLSNIVDLGTTIISSDTQKDNYVKSLVDHIGRVVFVDRAYSGRAPKVLMDAWEYGSIMEKISTDLPEATENESWALVNGQSYNPNVFYQPTVRAKFFNSAVTFEVPMSFTDLQVREAFSSLVQLNAFMSMLFSAIEKSMTIKLDSLIMRTINNFIATTLYDAFPAGDYTGEGNTRAINLLKMYNTEFSKSLTAEVAIKDKEFIRYASYIIKLYASRLGVMSTLFNIGGRERFTASDYLHINMLEDFAAAADTYLQSDTFHDELTKLPMAQSVPFWQGSGTDFKFDNTSKIHVVLGKDKLEQDIEIECSGIIAIMYDRDALGVTNMNRRTTSSYNPKGEFYSNWYKMDAKYYNDTDENFIIFFLGEAEVVVPEP